MLEFSLGARMYSRSWGDSKVTEITCNQVVNFFLFVSLFPLSPSANVRAVSPKEERLIVGWGGEREQNGLFLPLSPASLFRLYTYPKGFN